MDKAKQNLEEQRLDDTVLEQANGGIIGTSEEDLPNAYMHRALSTIRESLDF